VAALLLAVVAIYFCVSVFSPFRGLAGTIVAASEDDVVHDLSDRFFSLFGDPSAQQVDHYGDLAILAVSVPVSVLLAMLLRLRSVARQARDPETKQRPSGLGRRLIATRVAAPLLFLLSVALGGWAWLSVVHYGARGDQLTARAHLELSAHFRHSTLGPWLVRQRAYALDSSGGRPEVVFTFGIGTPVKELRVWATRVEDAIIELAFADSRLPTLRVPERECAKASGEVRFQQKRLTHDRQWFPKASYTSRAPLTHSRYTRT
jgi:hypothetical protein